MTLEGKLIAAFWARGNFRLRKALMRHQRFVFHAYDVTRSLEEVIREVESHLGTSDINHPVYTVQLVLPSPFALLFMNFSYLTHGYPTHRSISTYLMLRFIRCTYLPTEKTSPFYSIAVQYSTTPPRTHYLIPPNQLYKTILPAIHPHQPTNNVYL